jgi:DNA adenine methylase
MNTFSVKSPYPYFGGKSKVASVIWERFGEVSNYVEPFGGSLAMLLANPKPAKIETVNEISPFISNFWRAVSNDPDGVAKFADYPVTETDLHARHAWLVSAATDEFKNKMNSDPDYYDLKIAGWWVWGMGASIGDNWLKSKGLKATPLLSSAGGGIHGLSLTVYDWFKKLQTRTRRVRVCCGDWTRVVTPSVTYNNTGISAKDITAVFLDPPYDFKGRDKVYLDENNIFAEVSKWAFENGDNPKLRIALCGYEGDYDVPSNWTKYNWKTNGGLANLGDGKGKENAKKEVIYFSPYCLKG